MKSTWFVWVLGGVRLKPYTAVTPPTIQEADLAVDLPVLVVIVLNRRVVLHDERLLDELHRHCGLAHAAVAHNYKLQTFFL